MRAWRFLLDALKSNRWRARRPLAALGLALLVFFWPALFGGRTFYAFDLLFSRPPWAGKAASAVNNSFITDPICASQPRPSFITHRHFQEALRRKTLSLWDPSVLGGMPFCNYGSPIQYLIFSLLPITVGHDLLLLLGLSGAGVFMLLFLRELGLGEGAALIGATAWMYNGYVMAWFEFEDVLMCMACLPGILFCIEAWLRTRSRAAAAGLALLLGTGFGMAHPHPFVYLLMFVALYVVFRALALYEQGGRSLRQAAAALSGIAWGVGGGLALAPNFVYTNIAMMSESHRPPLPFAELCRLGTLPVKYLLTLVFPDFFGNPVRNFGVIWPQLFQNYNEMCVYAGIPALFLALGALVLRRQDRRVWFFAAALAGTLLCAMGTAVYYPIARWVPGMSRCTPLRILFLSGFSMAALAALGAQALADLKPRDRLKTVMAAGWGLLAAAVVCAALLMQTEGARSWVVGTSFPPGSPPPLIAQYYALGGSVMLRPVLLALATLALLAYVLAAASPRRKTLGLGLLAGLLFWDLGSLGRGYNTASPRCWAYPATPAIRFLQSDRTLFRIATLGFEPVSNSLAPFGIQELGGYASFFPRRYARLNYLTWTDSPDQPTPDSFHTWVFWGPARRGWLDLLNVKYFIVASPGGVGYMAHDPVTNAAFARLVYQAPDIRMVYDGEVRIYQNLRAFPRAFWVPRCVVAEDEARALARLRSLPDAALKDTVLLEQPLAPAVRKYVRPAAAIPAPAEADIAFYATDKMEVRVRAPQAGFLVVSDNYDPGWSAAVDGAPVPVLRANYVMRAVRLPPGRHTVCFQYRPFWRIFCLAWSVLGQALLAALLLGSGACRWL
jgi:hypothetical protein